MNYKTELLGIPFANLSRQAFNRAVEGLILKGKRQSLCQYVATVNADFLAMALGPDASEPRHPELLRCLREAALVSADGMPVLWLSKLTGHPIKERVCGSDIFPELCDLSARRGFKVYLLGASEDVLKDTVTELKKKYPLLQIVGTNSPMVQSGGDGLASSMENDDEILADIHRVKPDLLFLGMGTPKQELWFRRVKDRLAVPVTIGVGASFNFVSGNVSRAPEWMQKSGLEWLHRMGTEPYRLGQRYLRDAWCLAHLLPGLLAFQREVKHCASVPWTLRTFKGNNEPSLSVWTAPPHLENFPFEEGNKAIIDLSRCRCISPLVMVQWFHSKGRSEVTWVNASKVLLRTLKKLRCVDLFETKKESPLKDHAPMLSVSHQDDVLLVTPLGQWEARDQIQMIRRIDGSRAKEVHLSLEFVDRLECQSAGCLLQWQRDALHLGVTMQLSRPSNGVKKDLKANGLTSLFFCESDWPTLSFLPLDQIRVVKTLPISNVA